MHSVVLLLHSNAKTSWKGNSNIQKALFISRIDKPAIIGVRMPAVSMFHTIQRMATVVVRIGGGGGGRGKRKRKKQKLEHLEGCESCAGGGVFLESWSKSD